MTSPVPKRPLVTDPLWLRGAWKDLGLHEVPGPLAAPRIAKMAGYTTLAAKSDEVSWCSSAMNAWMFENGIEGTRSAAAISWEEWGVALPLDQSVRGSILIFDRHDDDNPNARHVTFDLGDNGDGTLACLGGNQGDEVKVSNLLKKKLLARRWPANYPLP